MFFFNGRIRNAHIAPMILRDRPYTNKLGHGCIITGCLVIIFGLTFIITGVISETKKNTFFGIGIMTLSIGFCFTVIVCFYTKLNICYRNWAYGPHILSNKIDSTHTVISTISLSPLATNSVMQQKTGHMIPLSNISKHKVRIVPSGVIGKTNTVT